MLSLERDALACSGIKPEGRCRTLALVASYGILGTPRARVIRETTIAWFQFLANIKDTAVIDGLRAVWGEVHNHLAKFQNAQAHVRGIINNVVCILLQAGWYPHSYNCWKDHEGSTYVLTGNHISPNVVANAIIKTFLFIDLVRASKHHDGKGMEHGIDFRNTVKSVISLKDT
jgi:hypothetical protein